MPPPRLRGLAPRAALAITALAALAVGGAWWLAPRWVAQQLERRALARGLVVHVGHVRLHTDSIRLEGLTIRRPDASLDVRLERVDVHGAIWEFLTRRERAAQRVEVWGVRARLGPRTAEAAAADAIVDRPPNGSRGPAWPLDLHGGEVVLVDAAGTVVESAVREARLADGVLSARGGRATIAPGSREALSIERWEAAARVDARTVERVLLEGVTWRLEGSGEGGASASRLVGRMREAARAALGGAPEAEGPVASNRWRRLSGAFTLALEDARVVRVQDGAEHSVVLDLDATLERTGASTFRTSGRGAPGPGGELEWRLDVEPDALRAEGDVRFAGLTLEILVPFLPDSIPWSAPERTTLEGSLRVRSEGASLEAEGRLELRDLAVSHPRIAPVPVHVPALTVEGRGTFVPLERRLTVRDASVRAREAVVALSGELERGEGYWRGSLSASLPPTPCAAALAAIPADLLQETAAFQLGGTFAGTVLARVDSRALADTRLDLSVADGCSFDAVPAIADLTRFEGPFVHRVEEPDGTIFEMTTGPGTEAWAPLGEVSPLFLQAVLGHEDAGFFAHEGFSPRAIREALVRNLEAGRYVLGASTISMQLSKNVFLHREKTLARKVQEVLLTWWVERAWTKERMLELYVNVIEYGPGIYGIRQASRHYFGVEPASLTPAQAAYLAMILPSPKTYHAHYDAGSLPRAWVGRVARFLRLLGERGRYDATAVAEGVAALPTLRFHRPEDPPVEPPTFVGRAMPLPIEGAVLAPALDAAWEPFVDDVEAPAEGIEETDAP